MKLRTALTHHHGGVAGGLGQVSFCRHITIEQLLHCMIMDRRATLSRYMTKKV